MLPTDPNTSMSTPFSSSSSSGELEYEDASIYFCVERDFRLHEWYVIKGNSKTPEDKLLRPIFPPPPKNQRRSGCGVVGSTIYVLGGMDYNQRSYYGNDMYDDVYYIDTHRPSSGWKKGCPMTTPRDRPYAVTVDDLHKMYVFGGKGILRRRDDVTPWAEVFDSKDGILYCMENWRRPGIMYGLDVSNPQNQIQRVLGCDNSCLPQEGYNYDDPAAKEFMVSLGNSKLAVIWSGYRDGFFVCCSKLNMSKRLNATTGQVDFVAMPLSLSYYSVESLETSSRLAYCLAIFPSQNNESKEEASKDASTSNDINSSNNNNNNDAKKKKKKKKKKRVRNKKKKQVQ
ncbi:hypothetical protein RHGRI_000057 [Rhododendron griersonianum]|uniref:Kelch repeat-containing protein n=1 Tax=Rhododendron griersonianum TaxID=479676 RepID=A0AAV6LHW0_9ERIC|nr:hypothetical protein RHGRI_000057 [Rhododendron griersonianum]